MAEPDNIVLEHLRAIRSQLDTLNERQLETMQRVGGLEVQVSNLAVQMANLSVRVDRIDTRLDRVERRLGLIEA
jgi:predicted  nucleic acid-binding Zn-ribbon protein